MTQDHIDPGTGRILTAAAGAALATGVLARRAQAGGGGNTRPFLLSIYQRGAADGLTFVCPYDDPDYQAKRVMTRLDPPGSGLTQEALPLALASGNHPDFGTAPALQPLKELFDEGALCYVHATGVIDDNRSHFDQQHSMETGSPAAASQQEATGWLARHLSSIAPTGDGVLRALAINPNTPAILQGGPASVPVPDPASYPFPGDPTTAVARRAALQDMYTLFGQPLLGPFENMVATIDKLAALDFANYVPAPAALYPPTPFGNALRQAAQMAKELPDLEIVHVDIGGWDTHNQQGVVGGGMAGLMADFAQSIHAFWRDLQADPREALIFSQTEFGRTLDENSSEGTDHGRGGVALVCGDSVNGAQVVTDWPGLDAASVAASGGDLDVSIDIRDIQAELVLERLGNPNLAAVFPDANYTYTERGVTS